MRPPKENVGAGKDSESPTRDPQVPPKAMPLTLTIQGEGSHHPSGFMPQVKVQVTMCLHDQVVTSQGLAKTTNMPSKGP
jgi:hypothetical protein